MRTPSISDLEITAQKIGADIYKDGRLNIWGIRTMKGQFNDYFYLFCWKDSVMIDTPLIKCTTEPGTGWLWKIMGNPKGTAILVPDIQYHNCWKKGYHNGYRALVQSEKAKFVVWRDKNQNGVVDYGGHEYTDVRGLNFHSTKVGYLLDVIGKFSAGCQVSLSWDNYMFYVIPMIYEVCKEQEYFSYTLIEETTLPLIIY